MTTQMEMRFVRLYTGMDEESHFDDIDVQLTPSADASHVSSPISVSDLRFGSAASGSVRGFHNALRRQLVVTLAGEVEFEVGGREVYRFGVGSVLFMEDMTGRGHIARCVGATAWRVLILSLAGGSTPSQPPDAVPSSVAASYVRYHVGYDNASYFEDVSVPLFSGAGIIKLSSAITVTDVMFHQSLPENHLEWPQSHGRQIIVPLTGSVEIVASDGKICRLEPGAVMLAEDVMGPGSMSRLAETEELLSLFVSLPT